MKTTLFLLLLCLSGCADNIEKVPNGIDVSVAGYYAHVREFQLQDGTHCAALVGYNKGAISCNWK